MAKAKSESLQRHGLSLYRKYRPSVFDELRGQEHITSVLRAAVEQEKIAHAYLFAGGRGTGKTSTARILARALGTSDSDIYEMDAASNRGIDEIRELRDGVATLPFESKYKFYIIDEAHALTPQAWQALLKTLEEPPNHTRFVLITHEKSLLLPTVLSRCQFIQFTPLPDSIRRPILRKAVERQGLQITEEVETLMLRLLGDGFERLDQLVSEEAISFLKSPSADLDEDWKLELFLDLQVIQNQKQALQELQQSANQFLKSSDVVLHATSRALEAARLRQRLSRYANKKLIALNAAQLGST